MTLLASTLELSDVFRQRAEETLDLQYVKAARQLVETTLREYVDGQELARDRTTRQTVVALYHSLARSLRKLGEERASSAANATAKRLAAELPTTETIEPP
jgi:hypothetical protein